MTPLESVSLLRDGSPVSFEQKGQRIILKDLPGECPDTIAGVTVFKLEFASPPRSVPCSAYPQLHGGRDYSGEF